MATRRIVVVAMLAAGFAGAARADDVYMKNGRVFEGVIVTALDDEQIRIRLAFGELALAANLVARVVDSESDLERYLDRRRQLVESSASAGEWLELAKWARNRDLDHGFREAALTAAAQDPTMDELAPYLRSLGYVLDKAAGLWVPYSNLESKSARSPVRSPEPQSAATPQSTEEHLSRAVELLAAAQLA
ncbi:MAG: hypothetical protein OEM62_05175, partial [Acidobacteriota bacterium]|nr:hypothetical protein [Acidobacteriota bacterium]